MVNWHPGPLLEVSPHDGPAPPGGGDRRPAPTTTSRKRNIAILDPGQVATDAYAAIVMGTSGKEGVRSLVIDRSLLDPGARVHATLADPEGPEPVPRGGPAPVGPMSPRAAAQCACSRAPS